MGTSFLWLEITGRCQLACVHCYAESGPTGSHGVMTMADWMRVLDQAAEVGVEMVQFIGGEPTLHPDLAELVEAAIAQGLEVEVYSNLVHIPVRLWATFAQPGVRLACSYYSDDCTQHAAVTGRVGSHTRTKANIQETLLRSIPLRVGVVELGDGQRAAEAVADLRAMGVEEVGLDRLRGIGRGVRAGAAAGSNARLDELCGSCASGVLAVSASGDVWPCVFSRWLPVGNVRSMSLAEILASAPLARVRERLTAEFVPRETPCVPRQCDPQCGPNCSPACNPQGSRQPCAPRGGCRPNYR